jgi:hypothetical protein
MASSSPTPDPAPTNGWNRFLEQKTAPQRFLLAVAAIATALAAIGGIGYTVVRWVADRAGGGVATSSGRVAQGSPEADALIKDLLSANGRRTELDVIVEDRLERKSDPIYAFVNLWYDCKGQPAGRDTCSEATLEFGDVKNIPVTVRDPLGVHFRGTFAISVRQGTVFGTDLKIPVVNILG